MNQLLSAPSDGNDELLPIREVSRLTGVNSVTLRAWERRYGLITPTRTEGGHRLYTRADVDTVRSILLWNERGVAVSKVGKVLAGARALDAKVMGPLSVVEGAEERSWQAQIRQAVNEFDEHTLHGIYSQLLSLYPLPVVFEDVLMPIWQDFVLRHDAFGQVSEWLFLDSFLRVRAIQCLKPACEAGEYRVLLAAIPGACRELELWVAALLMASDKTSVSVLAPGQPLEELGLVCGKMKPDALVLFSDQMPSADLTRRLKRVGMGLGCPLLLAGKTAELAQDSLQGSVIGCLGSDAVVMQRRLQQFLAGRLDT
ncbi:MULTISPECIES: MerR family transcriptional regulator [unclassified Pseudomonas]|uniref:MerR family transcriptional regulator n=1 Tax=unclassified Pseudomonas TaxID=196821 RepID=UPI0025E3F084|nr:MULTISPECIES: MerR family transcriptional regulator [unclassified Pseudomonas]